MKSLAALFVVLFIGCSSQSTNEPPPGATGWEPPPPPYERQYIYGEPDDTLRGNKPELFE